MNSQRNDRDSVNICLVLMLFCFICKHSSMNDLFFARILVSTIHKKLTHYSVRTPDLFFNSVRRVSSKYCTLSCSLLIYNLNNHKYQSIKRTNEMCLRSIPKILFRLSRIPSSRNLARNQRCHKNERL